MFCEISSGRKPLNVPGLGFEGNKWLGPICLSWKTLRTSSHLFALPSPDAQQHARRKTQRTHSASICIKSWVNDHRKFKKINNVKNKYLKKYFWKLIFLFKLERVGYQVSPHLRVERGHVSGLFPSGKRCGLPFKSTRRDKVTAVWLDAFKEACWPSWLDREQRRYHNVTCTQRLNPRHKRYQAAPSSGQSSALIRL